jgi:CRP/FNR family transcriptional regulator, cyclic AMP receptor protein
MGSGNTLGFDAYARLDLAGLARAVRTYRKGETVYAQGAGCNDILYLQSGEVTLSVRSKAGREATVAVAGPGDFFGEGALAGQPLRIGSAIATAPTKVFVIDKTDMLRLLHEQHNLSDRFIAHLLKRNARIEEDLIDRLFDPVEKRLARALLLLARYGEQDTPLQVIPRTSPERLAGIIGTTRSVVSVVLKKFKRLGFIGGDGPLRINSSLLAVVLRE